MKYIAIKFILLFLPVITLANNVVDDYAYDEVAVTTPKVVDPFLIFFLIVAFWVGVYLVWKFKIKKKKEPETKE